MIDQSGAVVGVHIGNRPAFGILGSKYSMAESSDVALAFLEPIVADLDVRDTATGIQPMKQDQVKELAEGSVFLLMAQKKVPRLKWSHRIEELHRAQKLSGWTSYEDRICMLCNGRREIECPNRGCAQGQIRKKVAVVVGQDPLGNNIMGHNTVYETCPVCHGSGHVVCPNCDANGIDNMLR